MLWGPLRMPTWGLLALEGFPGSTREAGSPCLRRAIGVFQPCFLRSLALPGTPVSTCPTCAAMWASGMGLVAPEFSHSQVEKGSEQVTFEVLSQKVEVCVRSTQSRDRHSMFCSHKITYVVKCTPCERNPNLMKMISQDKTREAVT